MADGLRFPFADEMGMGKTIQAISLIMTHRTDDPAKLPPVIPAAAASANVGVSARAVVRKVLDPSRPKLRLGGARPPQAEEGGSGSAAQAEAPLAADAVDDAGGVAAVDDAAPTVAEEPHSAHADGASLRCRSRSTLYPPACPPSIMQIPSAESSSQTPVLHCFKMVAWLEITGMSKRALPVQAVGATSSQLARQRTYKTLHARSLATHMAALQRPRWSYARWWP